MQSHFKKIQTNYIEIPKVVKKVVFRGFLLWFVFMVSYYYIFLPHGKLVKEFTHITSISTIEMLNTFYKNGFSIVNAPPYGEYIRLGARNVLYIMDGCNAFKLYVLYIGFLICAPGTISKKLIYGIVGVFIIFILNILRCYAIALLVLNMPKLVYFAHHYLFTIIVYASIFLLWLSFLRVKRSTTMI